MINLPGYVVIRLHEQSVFDLEQTYLSGVRDHPEASLSRPPPRKK